MKWREDKTDATPKHHQKKKRNTKEPKNISVMSGSYACWLLAAAASALLWLSLAILQASVHLAVIAPALGTANDS